MLIVGNYTNKKERGEVSVKYKKIIPCLDVHEGRVVKGVNFVDLKDAGNPVEIAMAYDEAGADELVFLDISATSGGRKTVTEMVAKVAEKVSIPFVVGGGIASVDDAKAVLEAGADKISINSAAVDNPDLIREISDKYGSHCLVVAIDGKRNDEKDIWEVYKSGGQINTNLEVVAWAKQVECLGAGEILLTSMDGDGTKSGYDIGLTRAVASNVNIPVTASGGAGGLEDFYQALTVGQAEGALAASLFHFKELEINQVKRYLKERGIEVRI
jgi:cyclase